MLETETDLPQDVPWQVSTQGLCKPLKAWIPKAMRIRWTESSLTSSEGVPGHGRFKTEKVQTPNHTLSQPWAPSCTDVNLLSLTTGSYESTGSVLSLSLSPAPVSQHAVTQ